MKSSQIVPGAAYQTLNLLFSDTNRSMEFQTVSETWVRPATPTPPHLRYLTLSLLDQYIGVVVPYFRSVFFYSGSGSGRGGHLDENWTNNLQLLKTSLSEILPKFYPLAGKIKDDLTIDCNDQGVRYAEARVNCDLDQFMTGTDLSTINLFFPVQNDKTVTSDIKVSVFQCGGLAVGLTVSHQIFDATSLGLFINSWAATARCGSSSSISPNFNSNSVFPAAKDNWLSNMVAHHNVKRRRRGNFVTKKLTFNSSSITKLRDLAISEKPPRRATRVEAVSALVWKSFLIASRELKKKQGAGATNPSSLRHSVNLRSRINPISMPEITKHTIGNLVWDANAIAHPSDEHDLGHLSLKIREAVSKINAEFIEKLRGDETEAKAVVEESLKGIAEVVSDPDSDNMLFTSWCKMGLYEADFGWGKPKWVGLSNTKASVCVNLVRLMDTSDGEGIEAWVTVDEHLMDMMMAAADSELVKFATLSQTIFGL